MLLHIFIPFCTFAFYLRLRLHLTFLAIKCFSNRKNASGKTKIKTPMEPLSGKWTKFMESMDENQKQEFNYSSFLINIVFIIN